MPDSFSGKRCFPRITIQQSKEEDKRKRGRPFVNERKHCFPEASHSRLHSQEKRGDAAYPIQACVTLQETDKAL